MSRWLVVGPGPAWPERKKKLQAEGIDAISVDILIAFQPDIVADIRSGLPGDNGEFDHIEILHVLEHVQLTEDFLHVMREMKRVLKPGGTIEIEVPHKDGAAAYESIEHTRFFTENSFKNFYDNPYGKAMDYPMFKLVSLRVVQRDGHPAVNVVLEK